MNRFAELLDRLAYEPGRNNKLRLMTDYFRTTPDPERGWALAALTGSLSFPHAKAGLIRSLIAERADPVLFVLSYDYVGDLSETVALMWPTSSTPARGGGGERSEARGGKSSTNAQVCGPQTPSLPSPASEGGESEGGRKNLSLTTVIETLSTLGKAQLPRQLARWLDALDETGRWALIKLVTGGLRIGVSARLAKAAVGALGDKDAQEIELIWPGLAPPYRELFAWLEGRAEKPASSDPAPFRPPMLAHALDMPICKTSMPPSSWRSGNGTAFACKPSPGMRTTRMAATLSRGFIRAPARTFPKAFPTSSTHCICPAPSTANS